MKNIVITSELKIEIVSNQNQLKSAIRNHQDLLKRNRENNDNTDLNEQIQQAEKAIILVGCAQKNLLEKLRVHFKPQRKSNFLKNNLEEKRSNFINALNRARKQNTISRSASVTSGSDDSGSARQSPFEEALYALEQKEISKEDFLVTLGLVTHEVHREMSVKRYERKRRSTANSNFLYNKRDWDMPTKRKRGSYLSSNVSPPNTRQSSKKKNERTSPPVVANGNNNHNNNGTKSAFATFPTIPNLPSGLTIERVSPTSSSPDSRTCVTCRQPGLLSICESCTNGFHVRCHNRPLTQTPRQCPRCIVKEVRTVGSLNVPLGMSVSYIPSCQLSEKLEEKEQLKKQNQSLTAELTQLQDRHSQLTISLKNQKTQQQELLMTQQSTEEKIQQIFTFINNIKNGSNKPVE